MDVLKPDLLWIEGRCYRLNNEDAIFRGEENEQFEDADYEEESLECPPDEPCDDFEVESIENGRYRTSLNTPRFYFPFIIGGKGAVRRRLENETRTQIQVPKQGQDGYIVITGSSVRNVSAARRRIDMIIVNARWKQQFTHFISLPMNGEYIKRKFLEFKKNVLEMCTNSRGVDESIFQVPEKLHLTLGTLVLMDKCERDKASEALEACRENVIRPILQNKSLKLSMIGIEYMNDDPAEVDVLYGKVHTADGSHVLQELADRTVDYFTSIGLMQKQYERVKLHVTLMNTLFRNEETVASEQDTFKQRQKQRESFDATSILEMFESFDFGDMTVDEMHLSLRYSKSKTGYYQATAQVSLT